MKYLVRYYNKMGNGDLHPGQITVEADGEPPTDLPGLWRVTNDQGDPQWINVAKINGVFIMKDGQSSER